MSYFAAAAVRGEKGWETAAIDLTGVADVEDVADRLRDVDPDADVSLLFVESDDVHLAILRLDDGDDLRVFGSDSVFAEESRLGALLLGEIEEPALEIDEVATGKTDDDTDAAPPAAEPRAEPVGDADLLTDLGIPAHRLLDLCAHDGLLPADVTAEICQTLGCADEVDELREA